MAPRGSVLETIIARKGQEVAALTGPGRAADLRRAALDQPPGRDLERALRACCQVPVVAEIKRASPSAGRLGNGFKVADLARTYEANGAAALSVLTDGPFFQGSLADLREARQAVGLPVLRKDFIIHPVQLYQSRAAQADAVLLIAAALSPWQLADLFFEALDLGLSPLVEVHAQEELASVLALDPPLMGINNRDLVSLEVSLETCLKLRPLIPPQVLVVGESGISRPRDVVRLRAAGVGAFLVGTALVRAPDPGQTLAGLCQARG